MKSDIHITEEEVGKFLHTKGYKALQIFRLDDTHSFSSKVFGITTETEQLVLKVCCVEQKYKEVKTLNEVEALKFFGDNTDIPVPKVIDYSNQPNDLGYEYILMTRIQGEPLNRVFFDCSVGQKKEYLRQIAQIIGKIKKFNFDKIGSFTKGQEIGMDVDMSKGPFHSSKQFIVSDIKARFPEMQLKFPGYIGKFEKYFEMIPEEKSEFVLCHGDLETKNFLQLNGRVTGLIDFEWAGSYPYPFEVNNFDGDYKLSEEEKAFFLTELHKNGVKTQFSTQVSRSIEMKSFAMILVSYHCWFQSQLEAEKFIAKKLQEIDKAFSEVGIQ